MGKTIHLRHNIFRDDRIVVGKVALDKFRDHLRFSGREDLATHFGRAGGIGPKRLLRLYDGPYGALYGIGIFLDLLFRRDQCGKGVIPGCGRAVAAPDIQNDRANAAAHSDLGPHGIGPKAINLPLLAGLGRREAEGDARTGRARNGADLDPIPCRIDPRFDEKTLQAKVHARRRADAQTFHCVDIAPADLEICPQYQQPVHPLRQRDQQLGPLPLRKGHQCRMRGAGDKIKLFVPERLHHLGHGKEKLDPLCVQPLGLKEAQLHGGDSGKVRVGYQVGDGDAHSISFPLTITYMFLDRIARCAYCPLPFLNSR